MEHRKEMPQDREDEDAEQIDLEIAIEEAVASGRTKRSLKLARKAKRRKGLKRKPRPDLTVPQILAWADAYFERTGMYPTENSGVIPETGGETWKIVASALNRGSRGFPRGSSLFRLLVEHRGVTRMRAIPHLSPDIILSWADAHRDRTGRWPTSDDGKVTAAPSETWRAINQDLIHGFRGLPAGSTLREFLAANRAQFVVERNRALTVSEVLQWADAHYARTGCWPDRFSGPISGAGDTTWQAVDDSLSEGRRGLPGGTSLARLLAEHRDRFSAKYQKDLTIHQILDWARSHYARAGRWPSALSGQVEDAPGENWPAICKAIKYGRRGLPGGSSLHRLLADHGHCTPHTPPRLTMEQILAWADEFRAQTGRWPTAESGKVAGTVHTTWAAINGALRYGHRGLPGGTSLAGLLSENRKEYLAERERHLPVERILEWADMHFAAVGSWPNRRSGRVPCDDEDTTWHAVDDSLKEGRRGLPKGGSLAKLLRGRRGRPNTQ